MRGTLSKASGSVKDLLASGLSAVGLGSSDPPDLAKFKSALDFTSVDAQSKSLRTQIYSCWDTNENGFLSLAETDMGVKTQLTSHFRDRKEGERIWKRFRKSYIRAFVDAADAAPQRSRKATTSSVSGKRRPVSDDDYVTPREFRLLVCYLQIYATMYELFSLIDGHSEGVTVDDDNRISRDEWGQGLAIVQKAAKTWAPYVALQTASEATFDEIDTNSGGFITLTEFCEWIEKGEKRAKTTTGELLGVGE